MKLPRSVTNLLENKYVLYFVLFLAVSNLLGYIMMGNMKPVFAFILIAYLVSRFSKNMILILGVPLFVVNLFVLGKKTKEGMDNNDSTKDVAENITDGILLRTLVSNLPDKIQLNIFDSQYWDKFSEFLKLPQTVIKKG